MRSGGQAVSCPEPAFRVAPGSLQNTACLSSGGPVGQSFCNRGYSAAVAQIDESGEWVFLTCSLPRDPSTPRLALWRRLKRFGVVQVGDGLVALPADARTREQFEWAADQAVGAGGRASVWLVRPTTRAQERDLARAMNSARTEEYQVVIDHAIAALDAGEGERVRALRRLRAENNRIRRRDYFRPPAREQARQALAALAETLQGDLTSGVADSEVGR